MPLRIRPALLACLIVALAAALPYLPTLDDYFVQDDFGVVALLADKPLSAVPRWFYTTWMDDIWGYTPDEIRPFPAASYRLAALAGAASPVTNHVLNVALHAANAVLVVAIARLAGGLTMTAAAVAGAAFALLPVQAETVAWVTGRVDSMPALFYLAAFLLYVRWRQTGNARTYAWSLLAFVAALFSKQNTITLAPALVLFDAMVERRWPRPTWGWLRPYVPYAAATVGYLLLRYAVFGEVARESALTETRVRLFLGDAAGHLRHLVAGPFGTPASTALALALATIGFFSRVRVALYFGLAWMALGILPTLVAGYSSPRHVYLASIGWAILLACGADGLWRSRRRYTAIAAAAAAAGMVSIYAAQTVRVVEDWRVRAAVSRAAVADLEREARAAPPGTLIIAGAPAASWAFALPFAARPPFAAQDLTRRVAIVSHSALHCCPAVLWEPYTRGTLRAWLSHPGQPPVIALYWHPRTGALGRLSDREEPYLRPLVRVLLDTDGVAALDRAIDDALEALVAPRAGAGR